MSRPLKPYNTVKNSNYGYKLTQNEEKITKHVPDQSQLIGKQQKFFLRHIDSISQDLTLDPKD